MVRVGKEEVWEDVYLQRVIVGVHSLKEKLLLEWGPSSFLNLVRGFP